MTSATIELELRRPYVDALSLIHEPGSGLAAGIISSIDRPANALGPDALYQIWLYYGQLGV